MWGAAVRPERRAAPAPGQGLWDPEASELLRPSKASPVPEAAAAAPDAEGLVRGKAALPWGPPSTGSCSAPGRVACCSEEPVPGVLREGRASGLPAGHRGRGRLEGRPAETSAVTGGPGRSRGWIVSGRR